MKINEIIFLVEEDPEGGLTARALGYSIFTEADNLEDMKGKIKDALNCHFEREEDIPSVIRLHIVKEDTFAYA